MIISNSTPLIYLTKLGKLNLLKDLFKKIIIPEEVFQEVVIRGKANHVSEALIVKEAVKAGWLIVRKIN